MEIVKDTDYFENQLRDYIAGSENPALLRILEELVHYGKTLEKELPSVSNREKRSRPLKQAGEFRASISDISESLSDELKALIEEFILYIEHLEAQIYKS